VNGLRRPQKHNLPNPRPMLFRWKKEQPRPILAD
jgi:hypothetical protein